MKVLLACVVTCSCSVALGGCVVSSYCYQDRDCDQGHICDQSTGQCQLGECSSEEDCGEGFTCEEHRCVPEGNGPLTCPEQMVPVEGAFCIDRYEASRQDATPDSPGQDDSLAVSRAGVLPWYSRPISADTLDQYQAACQAAGKHLCTKQEWSATCSGKEGTRYVFGDTFDPERCNCVDTFCDDYCQQNNITDCDTSANCGYSYNCFQVVPTGSFPGCRNSYGAFDLNGNVWELVPSTTDSRGYEVRGGAFNCANAAERLQCSYNAGWNDLYAGFRCCK